MPATTTTRQKLIQAALELFVSQGVSTTTTRQIANLATVNEVTLFRHFGNKYGLLLAVLEESTAFSHLGEALVQQLNLSGDMTQALKDYASKYLLALHQVAPLVRSVIGEADQYPSENRQALGQGLTRANCHVAEYFATVIQQGHLKTLLPPQKLASMLNGMLLGYAIIEFTTEFHQLWENESDFLEHVKSLFLQGAIADPNVSPQEAGKVQSGHQSAIATEVLDLPGALVHRILQQARKTAQQDYAIAYVLFGAGVSAMELLKLQRVHQICDNSQHILQVMTCRGDIRQVPVNQWIFDKRYGSYTSNPLTRWLKSRKDDETAMFLTEQGTPMTVDDLQQRWQHWVEGLVTPQNLSPALIQAQQTWCVEMLMRGVSLENLSILIGQSQRDLQPYAERAKQKAALEQATQLDRKPG